jgi:glycosyltransferase involved in cell wall biosynthesis
VKIALISYEFPPDTHTGGIGTYTYQAAHMLATGGHDVHVFGGSQKRGGRWAEEGVTVHRVPVQDRALFGEAVAQFVAAEHAVSAFDVMEAPEYGTEGWRAAEQVRKVAFVLRLHSPTFLIQRLDAGLMRQRHRWVPAPTDIIRSLLRPQRKLYRFLEDPEYRCASTADIVVSPSDALTQLVAREWHWPRKAIHVVPNVYAPNAEFLRPKPPTANQRVTFLGRVSPGKGICELVKAAKHFLRQMPGATLRVAGWLGWKMRDGVLIEDTIRRELSFAGSRLEPIGPVDQTRLPNLLLDSAVVVLPSHFENFPNTCLEAMAAGCAIVGSVHGGMQEQLDGGRCGLLVDPRRPKEISDAVVRLLRDSSLRTQLGDRARTRVLSAYSPATLLPPTLELYRSAIENARSRFHKGSGALSERKRDAQNLCCHLHA